MLWGEETYYDWERGGYVYEVSFCGEVVFNPVYPSLDDENEVQARGREFFAKQLKKGLGLV